MMFLKKKLGWMIFLLLFACSVCTFSSAAAFPSAQLPSVAEETSESESGEPDRDPEEPTFAVTGVTLDKTKLTMQVGDSENLTAVVEPEGAEYEGLVWTSSEDKVVTVTGNGKMTAKRPGTAEITVSVKGYEDIFAKCSVTVKEIPVSKVTLNKSKVTLEKGETFVLKASVAPANATDQTIAWDSNNKKVATVSRSGKVTAKNVGTAKITVKSGAKTAVCIVEVHPKVPGLGKVTSVAYNKLKITWKKVSGADGYRIYRKNGKNWKKIKTVNGASAKSYIDTVACGQKYTYTVKAWTKAGGTVYYSGYNKKGISGKSALSTPKLAGLTNISSTSAKFTWTKVDGASGYIVRRKTGSGNWKNIKTIKKPGTVAYTDKGLKTGTKYTYTVMAYRNVSGKKVKSGFNKTGKSRIYLSMPSLLSAKTNGNGNKLTWTKIKGASGYVVYRKNAGKTAWSKLAAVSGGSKTSYLDKKVTRGKSYVYAIQAKNGSFKSSYSNKGLYCVYSTDPAYGYAANVVNSITNSSQSNLQKLRSCHSWFNRPYRYIANRQNPNYLSGTGWISSYAVSYFRNHGGNCYRHACAYVYLARVLGYEPKLVTGRLSGSMNHGWMEITMGGVTYIFDSQWEYSNRHRGRYVNLFQRTYSSYRRIFSLVPQRRYTVPR